MTDSDTLTFLCLQAFRSLTQMTSDTCHGIKITARKTHNHSYEKNATRISRMKYCTMQKGPF